MEKLLHEAFFGQNHLSSGEHNWSSEEPIVAKRKTIETLMAYSKSLSICEYDALGIQETNLN